MRNTKAYFTAISVFMIMMTLIVFTSTSPLMAREVTDNPLLVLKMDELSDAEVTAQVLEATDFQVGEYLCELAKEDREQLLARDTALSQMCTKRVYRMDPNATMKDELSFNEFREEVLPYYEMAMNVYLDKTKSSSVILTMDGVNYGSTSGEFQIRVLNHGSLSSTGTYTISGLDTQIPIQQQSDVTVSEVIKGTMSAGVVKAAPSGLGKVKLNISSQNGYGAVALVLPLTFQKPAGYMVKLTKSSYSAEGIFDVYTNQGTIFADDRVGSSNIQAVYNAHVNLFINTTLGVKGAHNAGNKAVFEFHFIPISYYVKYDGNGATSGAVTDEMCLFCDTYSYKENAYQKTYQVQFDPNGGEVAKGTEMMEYHFEGWSEEKDGAVVSVPGQKYSGLLATELDSIARYAVWSPKSITLPIANRSGFSFVGWSRNKDAQPGDNGIMLTGTQFVTEENETLYAVWEKNSSEESKDDDNGEGDENHGGQGGNGSQGENGGQGGNGGQGSVSENAGGNSGGNNNENNGDGDNQKENGSLSNYEHGGDKSDGKGNGGGQDSKGKGGTDDSTKNKETILRFETNDEQMSAVFQVDGNNRAVLVRATPHANIKKLIIPYSVEHDGITYVISRIEANAFRGCKKIEKIIFKCKGLTTIGKRAFRDCKKLKRVDMSKLGKLTYISDECFRGCTSITLVKTPPKLKKIGKKAFCGCKKLRKCYIKSKLLNYVGSRAFYKCNKVLKFVVPKSKIAVYKALLN